MNISDSKFLFIGLKLKENVRKPFIAVHDGEDIQEKKVRQNPTTNVHEAITRSV